jgi:kynurenine 3-monooxygenase
LKQYTTPSTGLRIKALRIDPDFAIPKGGTGSDRKSEVPIETRYILYRLESATNGPTDSLPLSILPQKDPHSISARIVNVCTEPNHDLWNPTKIRTDDGGRSAKEYFVKAHPRYDWDKLVTEEEWEIFASTKGSKFPPCQYVPSMYVSSNDDNEGAGVVLLGDALHAFPPDLGQGVNAAFCDALLLGNSFEEAATTPSAPEATKQPTTNNSFVSKALKSYQEKNGPEIRALIALSRCGAPFQYNQASSIIKFQKCLWFANVLLRMLLNKVTLGWSPKPAMFLMMTVRTKATAC